MLFFLSSCQTLETDDFRLNQGKWLARAYLKVKSPHKKSVYIDMVFRVLEPSYFSIDVETSGLGIALARVVKSKKKTMVLLPVEKKQYFAKKHRLSLRKVLGFNLSINIFKKIFLQEPLNPKYWNCLDVNQKERTCAHKKSSLHVKWQIQKNGSTKTLIKSKQFLLDMHIKRSRLSKALTPDDFKSKRVEAFSIHYL